MPARVVAVLVMAVIATGLFARADPARAQASADAEAQLIERYAPRLRYAPTDECGPSSYRPVDVSTLFDNPQVVLRGPWDRTNVVTVAPSVARVAQSLAGYHLDFPGDALRPEGCVHADFQESLLARRRSTVYGRVARDADRPGALVVQYWSFYVYNDWKNRHEGDWEMVQVEFATGDVATALNDGPDRLVLSQHAGASVFDWDDDRLERTDATHPVLFPAAGSHATYARPGLYLARGGREGLGCDDARGDGVVVTPAVAVIPTDPGQAVREFPWLGFEGRWGEMQRAFFNGPTGPRDKMQWDRPLAWSEHRAAVRSVSRIPSAGLLTTPATDAFCRVVSAGAIATRYGLDSPTMTLLGAVTVLMLLLFAASRTRWRPTAPLRLAHRRGIGQMLAAAARMLWAHPRGVLGIGLVALPAGAIASGLQLAAQAVESEGSTGWGRAVVGSLLIWTATALPVLALVVIMAAVAWMVQRIDAGERPGPIAALRGVIGEFHRLALPFVALLAAQLLMEVSLVLAVVVALIVVRLSLSPVIVGIQGDPDDARPLRGSFALTRDNTWRTAVMALGAGGVAILIGPGIGVLALILTGWSFAIVNLIAAVVHTLTLSYAAIALTYLYADLRARRARNSDGAPDDALPAEFELSPGPPGA